MNANAYKPQYQNQPWKTLINLTSKCKIFPLLILRITSNLETGVDDWFGFSKSIKRRMKCSDHLT